jgi:putative acetyltransferase
MEMIKLLESHEVDEVMDVWLETTISAHSFISKKYWTDNYQPLKEGYIPVSTNFIYKKEGVVRGFISVRDNFFIGALFVLEKHQGKGIGGKLLDYCKSRYPYLELSVYIYNVKAVRFYQRHGFLIKSMQSNENSGFMEYIMSWEKKK